MKSPDPPSSISSSLEASSVIDFLCILPEIFYANTCTETHNPSLPYTSLCTLFTSFNNLSWRE